MAGLALDYPLRVRDGRFAHVEQDSVQHLEVQAEVCVRTPRGAIEAQPKTGLRSLIGTLGEVGPQILDALAEDVPGVEFIAEEDASRIVERIRSVTISLGAED